ncbi:hypothetical protein DFJ73DRAFT_480480 [Zopfochytrium polystomum]|nr:hypothetical protein DFJ73DRAFT_480480 [Zopfochytrium polystomum]
MGKTGKQRRLRDQQRRVAAAAAAAAATTAAADRRRPGQVLAAAAAAATTAAAAHQRPAKRAAASSAHDYDDDDDVDQSGFNDVDDGDGDGDEDDDNHRGSAGTNGTKNANKRARLDPNGNNNTTQHQAPPSPRSPLAPTPADYTMNTTTPLTTTPAEVAVAVRVLSSLAAEPDSLKAPSLRPLRIALHALQRAAAAASIVGVGAAATSLPGRVSDALADRRWHDAVALLAEMRALGIAPRLGALQRWVRDCDAAAAWVVEGRRSPDKVGGGDGWGDDGDDKRGNDDNVVDAGGETTFRNDGKTTNMQRGRLRRDGMVMRVLDAVMRTADPTSVGAFVGASAADRREADCTPVFDGVRLLGRWDCRAAPSSSSSSSSDAVVAVEASGELVVPTDAERAKYSTLFTVISREDGPARRPPNRFPMVLYTTAPDTIDMASQPPLPPERCTTRVAVPNLPADVFMLRDLLSPHECRQILAAAEAAGFLPDEPVPAAEAKQQQQQQPSSSSSTAQKSTLAHNVFWLADAAFMRALEARALPLLPPTLDDDMHDYEGGGGGAGGGGGKRRHDHHRRRRRRALAGINPRFRVYRYTPGAVYRPHIDGAWPRSRYDPDTGVYTYDASSSSASGGNGNANANANANNGGGNGEWSRLTLLLYLNEGFDGGETTYFAPASEEGVLDARAVVPRAGCAMVFPHGCLKTLLHEGSGVTRGAKYILRTDVLYDKEG